MVVYERAADGMLVRPAPAPPGGWAADGRDRSSITASQGSLAYDAHRALLYAVNPGSDTVSVFSVSGDGSTGARSSAPVARSRSASPSTATWSTCSTPATAARCRATADRRLPGPDHRLAPRPRPRPRADAGIHHTPGQVAFTPDGTRLIVTTKGNGNASTCSPSAVGGPSADRLSTPARTVPFAVVFDTGGTWRSPRQGRTRSPRSRCSLTGTLTSSTGQRPVRRPPAGSCETVPCSTPRTPAAARCRATATTAAERCSRWANGHRRRDRRRGGIARRTVPVCPGRRERDRG